MSALQNSKSDELSNRQSSRNRWQHWYQDGPKAQGRGLALSISAFGPIAGPIIGTVVAAALIAYGAEQVATILGFSQRVSLKASVAGQEVSARGFSSTGRARCTAKRISIKLWARFKVKAAIQIYNRKWPVLQSVIRNFRHRKPIFRKRRFNRQKFY